MYDYGWYANRHNWTPAQVDDLPAWIEARLPDFAQTWDQVMANRREEG
jgi:hypothetical protein